VAEAWSETFLRLPGLMPSPKGNTSRSFGSWLEPTSLSQTVPVLLALLLELALAERER
jgi:hypothetical protein